MKFKLSLSTLVLLTGCQLTQPSAPVDDEVNSNSDSTKTQQTVHKVKITPSKTELIDKSTLPQNQEDLWQRISMQFSLEIPDNKKVDYYRNWFLKHPRHLETVAERAQPFLYLITEKIEQRQFPLELALLPIVESSFDVHAYSHGKAAGLWQFLSTTGKRYGLEQDFWYDGRRDVEAATNAALNYLAYLNDRFDGNWYHAIAAYNSGGGRVSSAIRKNNRVGKPTDFFSLSLPRETSGYVPKLLALADVIVHREQYGLNIPAIANKPYLKSIDPKEQLDLRIAANYAGVSYKELRSYNPGYNQWATSPTGNQTLLLPLESLERFTTSLEENRGKGIQYMRYKVKRGDTVSTIAQRYDIPSSTVRKTNNLKNNLIRIGQYLLIPTPKSNSTNLPSDQQLASLMNNNNDSAIATQVTHTVQSGDNLWQIAKRYKVSHKSIALWNGITMDKPLQIGQRLIVKQLETSKGLSVLTYHVKPGDTLSEIALRYKVKSADIMQWNNLSNQSLLKVGQTLKLYLSNQNSSNS